MRAVRALVWLAVSAHCLPQLDPPVGLSVDEAGESSSPGGVAVMIEPRHIPERALVLSNAVEVLSSTRPEDFWSIVLLHGGGDVTDVTGNSALRAVRAQLLPEGGLRLLARNPNSSLWYNDFLKTPELWSLFEQKHLLLFESDSAFCATPTVPIADFVSGTLAGRPLYGAPWPVGGWGEMGGCVGNSGFSLWDRTAMLNVTQRARDENGGVSPIGTAIDRWASSQFRRTGRTPLCGQTPPNAEESLRYAQTANMFSVPPQRLEPACLLTPARGPVVKHSTRLCNPTAQVETVFRGLNNSTEYVPVGVHKMWLYNNRDVVDALIRRGCPAIGELMALGADYGQRHNHDSAAIAQGQFSLSRTKSR